MTGATSGRSKRDELNMDKWYMVQRLLSIDSQTVIFNNGEQETIKQPFKLLGHVVDGVIPMFKTRETAQEWLDATGDSSALITEWEIRPT